MQTDAQLVALIREGHDRAFEVLFNRYQSRLLAFCRRLVGSPQDAEDVLQEVFAAAHAGILADSRPINARPWLYRIARNRCMNHLRKPTADGVDSMDIHVHENGTSTLERVQRREELRAIVADVHGLPKTQRTALVLRAIDDRSYTDIAEAMNTTLPSVKSLMVRARMSLAQSIQARGALAPLALLALLRKLIPAKLGGSSGAGGAGGTAGSAGSAAGTASGVAGAVGGGAAAGSSSLTVGGVVSAASTAATGIGGALGAKAAVGVATAALLTAGAVSVGEMNRDSQNSTARAGQAAVSAPAGTTSGIWPSAISPPGGVRAAAQSAGAAGPTAGVGSGHGKGLGAGKPSVKHGPPVELPVARGHALRGASAAAGGSALAPGHSTIHPAPKGLGASLSPSHGRSAVPPKPRPERPVVDLPRTRPPGPPIGLPKRPKLPKPHPRPKILP